VNGMNVDHEPSQEIFRRIKAMGDRVSLLVVDYVTEQYFRQHDVIIDGQMSQVLRVTCPDVKPAEAVAIATDSGIKKAVLGTRRSILPKLVKRYRTNTKTLFETIVSTPFAFLSLVIERMRPIPFRLRS